MSTLKDFYNQMYLSDKEYKGGFEESKSGLLRFQKIFTILKKILPKKQFQNLKVLDIGCSTGEFLRFIQPFFKEITGIDISDIAIKSAKSKGLENVFQIDIEHQKLPFKDESFDLIFCLEVLEHLLQEKNCLFEIKRILKPEALVLITVPNDVLQWRKRFKVLFGKIPFQEELPYKTSHLRFFSKRSLKKTLEENGFDVLFIGSLPISWRGINFGFIGEILTQIFTDFLPLHYIIIGKKINFSAKKIKEKIDKINRFNFL